MKCSVVQCVFIILWFNLVSETFIKAYTWPRKCGCILFEDDSQITKDILLQWEDECSK